MDPPNFTLSATIQWAALYFCMGKIGKSTSLPQLYANGGRLILYLLWYYRLKVRLVYRQK